MVELQVNEVDSVYQPKGNIEDGGKNLLKCSACGKKLVEVWITRPKEQQKKTIQAHCDYCGDKSFTKEITGGFHLGITDDSAIDEIVTEGNLITVTTKKVRND